MVFKKGRQTNSARHIANTAQSRPTPYLPAAKRLLEDAAKRSHQLRPNPFQTRERSTPATQLSVTTDRRSTTGQSVFTFDNNLRSTRVGRAHDARLPPTSSGRTHLLKHLKPNLLHFVLRILFR